MGNAINQTSYTKEISDSHALSFSEKFTEFCKSLESSRILLLSGMLLIQCCIFVPATILVTSFIDIGLGGVSISILAAGTVGVLVTNMGEAPVKAVLLTFISSIIANTLILAIHLLS